MSDDRDDNQATRPEDMVCAISMMSPEVRVCRSDCRAFRTYKTRDGEVNSVCVFVSSLNQISMAMSGKGRSK
jgi:hypothetical protein